MIRWGGVIFDYLAAQDRIGNIFPPYINIHGELYKVALGKQHMWW